MNDEIRQIIFEQLDGISTLNSQIYFGRAVEGIDPVYAVIETIANDETKDTALIYETHYIQVSVFVDANINYNIAENLSNEVIKKLDESESKFTNIFAYQMISIDCIKPTQILSDPDYWQAISEFRIKAIKKKIKIDVNENLNVNESIN